MPLYNITNKYQTEPKWTKKYQPESKSTEMYQKSIGQSVNWKKSGRGPVVTHSIVTTGGAAGPISSVWVVMFFDRRNLKSSFCNEISKFGLN